MSKNYVWNIEVIESSPSRPFCEIGWETLVQADRVYTYLFSIKNSTSLAIVSVLSVGAIIKKKKW